MNNELKQATAIVDSLPVDAAPLEVKQNSKPLSGLNRQLTEDDLKSPGVRKLLLGQMDEYENCKSKLEITQVSDLDFEVEFIV